jgi:tRNA (cytidine/uridine-2'-O-)-methyltransferase
MPRGRGAERHCTVRAGGGPVVGTTANEGQSYRMRLALYQPDIPQNAGTILRLAACMGVAVDVIGPAGFDFSDRNLRRAGLDYLDHVEITRHVSFTAYLASRRDGLARESRAAVPQDPPGRLVLLTTAGDIAYPAFRFAANDTLLLGRESAGAPADVHAAADARVRIPLRPGLRSLNIAVAAAMVLGEALRQTGGLGD